MELLISGCRTLYFSLLGFTKFLSTHFSCPGPSWWRISHPFQICVISKLAKVTLCPIIQIINEDVEQDCALYWLLGYITSYCPPIGLCSHELSHSASFQPTSLSAQPAHTSSASLWRCYGRQCKKPQGNQDRQDTLLFAHPPGQSFHHREYRVGQVWLPLSESMLTIPDDLLV